MDDCPRQNPAYRHAKEEAPSGASSTAVALLSSLVSTARLQVRLRDRGTRGFRSFVRRSGDRRLERTIGSRMGLRIVFDRIAAGVPGFAVTFAGEFQCDLRRTDGSLRTWTIDTRSGRVIARRGVADSPLVTARLSVADFVRVVGGELDPGRALLDGRLDLAGDFSVVTRLGDVVGALGGD